MLADDQLRAVSFAAGTAAFMACVERAVMVSVFVHWRVWAFLALNLLLLAILFTSKSQSPLKKSRSAERSTKRRHFNRDLVSTSCTEAPPPHDAGSCAPPPKAGDCVEKESKSAKIEGKLDDYDELSEEELKQRVEDFIAMFRQHLVCDAKGVKL